MNTNAGWIFWLVGIIGCFWVAVAPGMAAEKRVCRDADHDGVTDQVAITDEQGKLLRLEIYSQFPGRPAAVQYYKDNVLIRAEKDANNDGKNDVIVFYETPDRILERQDTDNNGGVDLETRYEDGQRTLVRQDLDGDGKMERVTLFDKSGEVAKITVDTNADGRPDEWQAFKKDCLEWVEKDRNHDQQVDLKIYYTEGEQQRLIKDENHNGYFEITQRFDRPPWKAVVEVDADENKVPEAILFHAVEGLRQRENDANQDGRMDSREYLNDKGRVIKSEESADGATGFNQTWFYDESGRPVRAEKDASGDGKPDIWYYYNDGRLTSVREDTNRDGRPDLWEEYGASGTVIRQSRDLNADGVPDMTREYKKQDAVSHQGGAAPRTGGTGEE